MIRSLARTRAGHAVSTALVLLPGCIDIPIDDQRLTSAADRVVVNPVPVARDFAGQNARHRVLLALIDTGVDYNHPLLSENIHFTLDAAQQPVGLGWDHVGEDEWPAPYVARTSRYDPEIPELDRYQSQAAFFNASRLVELFPDMTRFFHPSRHVYQEVLAGVDHGTHVAGLMVHDRLDIGLLAYRVLPYNRAPGREEPGPDERLGEINQKLIAAIEDAVAAGARVVNLSLMAQSSDPEQHSVLIKHKHELGAVIGRYPHVLFVGGAGNSGAPLDEHAPPSYPCGLHSSNILCVGALRANGAPWEYSNIPVSGLDAVFVLGEDVLSTVPVDLCPVPTIQVLESKAPSDEDLTRIASTAKKMCEGSPSLRRMSGTSMATPLMARVAGEILIEHPELTAAGVIQEIYRRATPDDIDGHPILKLSVPIPSWYLLEQPPSDTEDTSLPGVSSLSALENWVAYLPGHMSQ